MEKLLGDHEKPLPMPVCVEVKAGELYHWCSCGHSKALPFCDNGKCGDKSIMYQSPHDDTVYFCNCRRSQDPPLCDGSHAELLVAIVKERQG